MAHDAPLRPRQPSRRTFGNSPLLVFYEVTQTCDLVCAHCRACAQPHSHPGELNTHESLGLIDQLSEFPLPPTLVLTGGDPFKRADIYDLVAHATRRQLDVAITPSTTSRITATAIRRLPKIEIGLTRIGARDGSSAHHNRRESVDSVRIDTPAVRGGAHEQRSDAVALRNQAFIVLTPYCWIGIQVASVRSISSLEGSLGSRPGQ